jgi:hypothetical protein
VKSAVSRAVMALAVHCLPGVRREWANAMLVEFEAAREDEKPLSFATGCLGAALRELPKHQEGRFAIASWLLTITVIVPAAGVLISMLVAGSPLSFLNYGEAVVSEANRPAVPSLLLLLFCLATLQLRVAWLTLGRDWESLIPTGAMSAAVALTLSIFTAVVFDAHLLAVLMTTGVALELAALALLAGWHAELPAAAAGSPPNGR